MSGNDASDGLERRLGLVSVTSIVIANMIGAGIFTTSGLLLEGLGSPGVMVALWLVGGVIALCGALCYGELGAAIPRAGGEYTFLSRLFHPLLGFLTGWVSFFAGFSAPIAASAIGFAEYLTRAFPALLQPGLAGVAGEAASFKKAYAILAIAAFAALHARGVELGAKVQNLLTGLKVSLILGLVAAGFGWGEGTLSHFSGGEGFVFDFGGWKRMGLALMWIMFAYSGWNAAAYIGSEIKDPSKNLPRSLLAGTVVVIVLYFALNVLYVWAVPPAEMGGIVSIGGLTVARLFGRPLEASVSVLIAFALFSSLSAFIILGPRVYFSMARDGAFFGFAGRIHPRFGVPSWSILLQGAIAAVMVLLGSFDQILTYMGFSLGIFPILAVCGVFRLRHEGRSVFRMPGYPVVPAAYILSGVAILVLGYLERPAESSIAMLTVAAGVPAYAAFRSSRRREAAAAQARSVPGGAAME